MIASSDWGAPALELARAFREALLLLLRGRGLALLLRAQLALAMRVALFIRELYQRLLGLRAHSENKTRESGRRKDGARGGGRASARRSASPLWISFPAAQPPVLNSRDPGLYSPGAIQLYLFGERGSIR